LEAAEQLALLVALGACAAVWRFMPPLIARPSSVELFEANRALSGAAQSNAAELERLSEMKVDLEKAVAARTRELDEVNQRFLNALKGTGISMSQQDQNLRYLWVHNLPAGLCAEEVVGKLQAAAIPTQTEPLIAEAKRRAMTEQATQYLDVSLELNGNTIWLSERIEPLLRDGRVVGVLTTAIDTTAHRRQEDELRGVLRELTHRTKNLLAVIVGIARQSSKTAADVNDFLSRFNSRIRALSVAHDLLVDSSWRGVSLRLLITGVWRINSPQVLTRVTIAGEDLYVAPNVAQNLALAFHEMASNAILHGGLLQNQGRVAIEWTSIGQAGVVELNWSEIDCALLLSFPAQGFGKSFVEDLLPRATGGRSSIEAVDGGIRWTLTLPKLNFVEKPEQPAQPLDAQATQPRISA
jgi:two-component sensor histidine kinase